MLHSAPGSCVANADAPDNNDAKLASEMDSSTPKTPTHLIPLWVLVVVVVESGGGGVGSGREGGRRVTTTATGVAARLGQRGGAHGRELEWPRA